MPRRLPRSLLRAVLGNAATRAVSAQLSKVTRWATIRRAAIRPAAGSAATGSAATTSRNRPAPAADVRPPAAWAELVALRAPQLLAEPGQQPSGARRGGHAPEQRRRRRPEQQQADPPEWPVVRHRPLPEKPVPQEPMPREPVLQESVRQEPVWGRRISRQSWQPSSTGPVASRRAATAPRFPQLPGEPTHRAVAANRWPELADDRYHGREPVFDEDGDRSPWPALPDDTELWLVPRAAFTERQLRYLDQEQEGRPWNG
jgi:hypothetical protein